MFGSSQSPGTLLRFVPDKEKDSTLCESAFNAACEAIKYFPKQLLTEENVYGKVEKNSQVLKYLPPDLITRELCILAMEQEYDISLGKAIPYTDLRIKLVENQEKRELDFNGFPYMEDWFPKEEITPELAKAIAEKDPNTSMFCRNLADKKDIKTIHTDVPSKTSDEFQRQRREQREDFKQQRNIQKSKTGMNKIANRNKQFKPAKRRKGYKM